MGHVLAICGWMAWQTRRLFDGTRLSGASTMLAPSLAVVLVVLAAVPVLLPFFEAQPEDVEVQQIFDGTVSHPDGWVRLSGRISPLQESPTGEDGTLRTPRRRGRIPCAPSSSRARPSSSRRAARPSPGPSWRVA